MNEVNSLFNDYSIPVSDPTGSGMRLRAMTEETFNTIIEIEKHKAYHIGEVNGMNALAGSIQNTLNEPKHTK